MHTKLPTKKSNRMAPGILFGHPQKMMRRISTHPACFGILLTATMLSADPSEKSKELSITLLDPTTVYATRSPHSTFHVPAMVSNVETATVGQSLAGDLGDLLEFTSGAEVGNGPRRNGQTISVRGFDNASILLLIDRRRQNFESNHDGRFYLDPSLLQSAEVVKGASSAIYGGGAIGGVVAFQTKDAADLLAPDQTTGALTSFGYRSANKEYSSVITGYSRMDGWDLLGSLSYRRSGDIKQGFGGDKLNTEDQVLSGLFKAGYTLNHFHTLKLQLLSFHNDGQEPNNGTEPLNTSNPIVDKKVEDNQFSLKYAFEDPYNSWLNPMLHAYYNDTRVEEKDITGRNAGRIQTRELDTLGFTADNQTQLLEKDTHTHLFSYGFEIYNDQQTGTSSTTGSRAGVPNAEATHYGFYLQDEITLKGTAGDFLIIPAMRFDQYESNDEIGHSQDKSGTSPKFSMSYNPTENVVFFGSWAQAFRAPSLTELYSSGLHFPGIPRRLPDNHFIPNPNLKPEKVTTIEFGAGFKFENLLTHNDRAKIKGSWFTSAGEDLITLEINTRAGTTKNLNVTDATITGWEVEGQYELYPVTAKASLSYVEAENDQTGEYLSNNIPLTLVTDISHEIAPLNSVIGWRSRFAKANDKVGRNDTATAGYGIHDLYYRWKSNDEQSGSLTVDLGVDNIFDKAYTKRFASLLEEGRSFSVKASYKW